MRKAIAVDWGGPHMGGCTFTVGSGVILAVGVGVHPQAMLGLERVGVVDLPVHDDAPRVSDKGLLAVPDSIDGQAMEFQVGVGGRFLRVRRVGSSVLYAVPGGRDRQGSVNGKPGNDPAHGFQCSGLVGWQKKKNSMANVASTYRPLSAASIFFGDVFFVS